MLDILGGGAIWGRRVGRSPLDSHPETERRTTMCEASVALAIERSAASKACKTKTRLQNDVVKTWH